MAIRLAITNLFIYLIGNYGDHQGDLSPCHGPSINLLFSAFGLWWISEEKTQWEIAGPSNIL